MLETENCSDHNIDYKPMIIQCYIPMIIQTLKDKINRMRRKGEIWEGFTKLDI